MEEYNDNLLQENNDLDTLIVKLNDELKGVIGTLTPPKEVSLSSHPKKPWFDSNVKNQHKVVRNCERVWLKYKLQSNWTTYKVERNIYTRLLNLKKRQAISHKVNELRGNTKGLYQLTTNLTGNKPSNPMPPGKSDAELADNFMNFFLNKIHKIRQQFMGTDAYSSEPSDTPRLRRFQPFTESQVKNIISSMQSKSCELDATPTHMLKRLIDKCLLDITKIVNISLMEGIFNDKWKVRHSKTITQEGRPCAY